MTNKWHPLDKPLPKAQDRCSQPRWHKHTNKEDEWNGSYKSKTCWDAKTKKHDKDQLESEETYDANEAHLKEIKNLWEMKDLVIALHVHNFIYLAKNIISNCHMLCHKQEGQRITVNSWDASGTKIQFSF